MREREKRQWLWKESHGNYYNNYHHHCNNHFNNCYRYCLEAVFFPKFEAFWPYVRIWKRIRWYGQCNLLAGFFPTYQLFISIQVILLHLDLQFSICVFLSIYNIHLTRSFFLLPPFYRRLFPIHMVYICCSDKFHLEYCVWEITCKLVYKVLAQVRTFGIHLDLHHRIDVGPDVGQNLCPRTG